MKSIEIGEKRINKLKGGEENVMNKLEEYNLLDVGELKNRNSKLGN